MREMKHMTVYISLWFRRFDIIRRFIFGYEYPTTIRQTIFATLSLQFLLHSDPLEKYFASMDIYPIGNKPEKLGTTHAKFGLR